MPLRLRTIGQTTTVDYANMTPSDWVATVTEWIAQLPAWEEKILASETPDDLRVRMEERFVFVMNAQVALSGWHDPHQTEESTSCVQRWAPALEEAELKLYQNADLYQKIKSMTDADLPSPAWKKWHKDQCRAFERSGCSLSEIDREQLQQLRTSMVQKACDIQSLLLETSQQKWSLMANEVDGIDLPPPVPGWSDLP